MDSPGLADSARLALAWVSLAAAFATAGAITFDILGHGYRQRMAIMEVVWPVTALYVGPPAWFAYRRWGQVNSPKAERERDRQRPYGEPVAIAVSHCGAAARSATSPAHGSSSSSPGSCSASRCPPSTSPTSRSASPSSTSRSSRCAGSAGATASSRLEADTLSLVAFEVGLFGWMAFMQLVLFTDPHLPADHAAYWLLMQIGMVIGFATAYPANRWLIRSGLEEAI